MATDHESEHECDMCGETFDSEDELEMHNEEEHDM